MKIRAVVIDDEVNSVKLIVNLLKSFQQIEVVGTADSVDSGLLLVEKVKPFLVFLDVEMPGQNGFSFLARKGKLPVHVIIVSAFDYALKAYQNNVLQYLLKPVDIDDLAEAIKKAELTYRQSQTGMTERPPANSDFFNPFNKISVPGKEGLAFINITEIIRCEGLINYTKLYLKSGEVFTSSKTLLEFEKLLGRANFFRIHKSHLINLTYLKGYVRGENGYVIMSDGSTLHVSRKSRELFIKRIASSSLTWALAGN